MIFKKYAQHQNFRCSAKCPQPPFRNGEMTPPIVQFCTHSHANNAGSSQRRDLAEAAAAAAAASPGYERRLPACSQQQQQQQQRRRRRLSLPERLLLYVCIVTYHTGFFFASTNALLLLSQPGRNPTNGLCLTHTPLKRNLSNKKYSSWWSLFCTLCFVHQR